MVHILCKHYKSLGICSVLIGVCLQVSLKLLLIHVLFLRRFCKGTTGLQERADRYDETFGALTLEQDDAGEEKKASQGKTKTEEDKQATTSPFSFVALQREAKIALGITSWPHFYALSGFVCPSKAEMIEKCRARVQDSLTRGYHTVGMDFSRIHKSGVSAILHKGESYQLKNDSQLDTLKFVDTWKFEGDTKFLDSSVLAYSQDKKLLYTIDYVSRIQPGMRHSGDQMGHQTGLHEIEIKLSSISSDVYSLVFVLSAWEEALLKDILEPSVSFYDEKSGDVLCSYKHHAKNTGRYKAIVMCKLERTKTDGWRVQAIGEMCYGDTSNYALIRKCVQDL
eukprot:g10816.t1